MSPVMLEVLKNKKNSNKFSNLKLKVFKKKNRENNKIKNNLGCYRLVTDESIFSAYIMTNTDSHCLVSKSLSLVTFQSILRKKKAKLTKMF